MKENLNTWKWWAKGRLQYNLSFVVSGICAFTFYCIVVFSNADTIHGANINGLTTLGQAIVYLLMVGIANVCYFLGPVSECIIKPNNVIVYRKITYGLGYWFSVILPFLIPIFLLLMIVFYPEYWD